MSSAVTEAVIRLRGVRQNNLKGFDLDLPQRRLIVITGLSGSGKSSLAFETLFAEGQRRYVETFSPYARQFFDRMDKPRVDSIEGIPPAIAIEQRNAVRTTRSTVGTMTEICDYLKVVWPHLAQLHCRKCGQPVRKDTPQSIWQQLNAERETRNVESPAGKSGSQTDQDTVSGELMLKDAPLTRPSGTLSPHPMRGEGGVRGEALRQGGGPSSPVAGRASASLASASQGGLAKATPASSSAAEVLVTFDLPLADKLSLKESLDLVSKQGYQRLLIGREVVRLEDAPTHLTPRPSRLTVVQDRVRLEPRQRARFVEACEQAYHFGKGRLAVHLIERGEPNSKLQTPNSKLFSNRLHCAACDLEYREPSPALFSFNNPVGACPACKGFGRIISIDYRLAIPDRRKSLAGGAVKPWQSGVSADCQADLKKFCRTRGVPMDVPFADLPKQQQDWVIEGDAGYDPNDPARSWPKLWYGVKGYFRWLESKAYKMHVRVLLSRYRAYTPCPACEGRRLQPDALLYRLPVISNQSSVISSKRATAPSLMTDDSALSLPDFYNLTLRDALNVIEQLVATHSAIRNPQSALAHALEEVRSRLRYLVEVGLGYLTLDRPTRTLSGGETERVNLTTCLGSGLVNTLYVLDEPSVGLHARDTGRLVRILERLRDAGNTVVVVEHEAAVIRAADQVVDLGPAQGERGGQLVFQGTFKELCRSKESLTGQYLGGRKRIETLTRRAVFKDALGHVAEEKGRKGERKKDHAHPFPPAPFPPFNGCLILRHASLHNLSDVTVEIPLNRLVCVTGVSGSGKTTLIREVLLPLLQAKVQSADLKAAGDSNEGEGAESSNDSEDSTLRAPHSAVLEGWEALGRVLMVDQSALGRTPRSNPAVYIGAFDAIREFFAQSEAARQQGLDASAFSFNSARGQCERCRGAGFEKIEMQFLSDVFVRCPDCNGRRYRKHILEVKVAGFEFGVSSSKQAAASADNAKPQTPNSKHKEWSIGDLLEATVDDAIHFLSGFAESRPAQKAAASLRWLQDVGLGYLRLGQPINTLSGGECQRLKLVSHLAESVAAVCDRRTLTTEANSDGHRPTPQGKPTLFLFDEPTTGLHFDDVRVLLGVFQRLVDAGHSVLVIEHNLDVIQCADWVIDLGPDAGDEGGRVVVCGTPEQIAQCNDSHTGRALNGQEPGIVR
jgi:excinuclease ABC subunit A